MKYRILLERRGRGDCAEIVVPARLPLEQLVVYIKLELQLPYTDHCWHRFLSHGMTYVPDEHLCTEEDFLAEYNIKTGPYRSSDSVRLRRMFTTLGSTVTYQQDHNQETFIVRCTLLERMD